VLIVIVFGLCYLGMALGRLPGLHLDRSGIAFGAGAVLVISGAVSPDAAWRLIDHDTLLLLLGLMVLSAEFRFSGVYAVLGQRLSRLASHPLRLLAVVILVAGGLSAVLVNDIVALALAPLLIQSLRQSGRPVLPYLLALACACNAGSAASLVGNPQNILIGQRGMLDFWAYSAVAAIPASLALLSVFLVIAVGWRGRWGQARDPACLEGPVTPPRRLPLKPWLLLAGLLLLFATPLPRELSALAVAVLLLLWRRRPARDYLLAVDGRLLLLFTGLFVVTGALGTLPAAQVAATELTQRFGPPDSAVGLGIASLLGSNLVGNVPYVLLLLSLWPTIPGDALIALALLATLAGNFLLVGSVVNLIVAESAGRLGHRVGFWSFARVGVPVTLLSMSLTAAWLTCLGLLPLH
jgi:Na+/H+ antiporter NhaD/arsenite permease-like protein